MPNPEPFRLFRIEENVKTWVALELVPACIDFIEAFCGNGMAKNQKVYSLFFAPVLLFQILLSRLSFPCLR